MQDFRIRIRRNLAIEKLYKVYASNYTYTGFGRGSSHLQPRTQQGAQEQSQRVKFTVMGDRFRV